MVEIQTELQFDFKFCLGCMFKQYEFQFMIQV